MMGATDTQRAAISAHRATIRDSGVPRGPSSAVTPTGNVTSPDPIAQMAESDRPAEASRVRKPAEVAPPQLSVIVLTYNVRVLLRDCLTSVYANCAPFDFEVLVVDTGQDGSAAMVRQEFSQSSVIEAPENPGFAAGNNLGLRRARGTFCLLLNPDTVVLPDTLERSVSELERQPRVGIVGARLVRRDGALDLACRRSFPTPRNAMFHFLRLPKLFPWHPGLGEYNLTHRDPRQSYEVDAVSGAFLLIRRQVLEQIGLLDETYWMYGEDLDLCWRSKAQGWITWYAAEIEVLHLKGQSSRARSLRCTYEFYRAMIVFYRKFYASHAPAAQNALVHTAIVAIGAASLIADRLRLPSRRRVSR